MTKNLLYTALGLMGLMGTLTIGVVSAETTITHYTGSNIEYRLNDNTEHFTGVGTITITDGTDTITILDRNLGAKKAGTGCDFQANGNKYCSYEEVYGYHFQWGNNHGFKPGCDLSGSTYYCSDTITTNAVNGQVNATTISYNPASQEFYNSGVFYKGYDNWLTDNSKVDLWGGSTGGTDTIISTSSLNGDNWKVDESTVKNRQGPCPEGFHVPSIGELNKLVSMMTGSNNSEKVTQLHSDLYIPFAGGRSYFDASVYNMGTNAFLWLSSPCSASDPEYSRDLYLNVDGDLDKYYDRRALANSVRCFYDSYQPFTQTFTLSFTGAEGGSISTGGIEAEEGSSISRDDEAGTVSISGTVVATGISDEGYAFSGWTTDCVSGTVTTGCSFTGVFKTIPYTITYLGTGDDYIPSATGYTIESDDITLENPTKIGYTFTGRSGTDLEGITGAVIISKGSTGDRVYEANREANEYTITIDIDGNETILTGKYGDPISKPADPSKNGYKFIGWEPEFPTTMPLSGATVKAKWEKLGGSGGGGGRSSNTSDKDKDTTNNPSVTDVTAPLESGAQGDSNDGSPLSRGDTASAERGSTQNYTQEFQEAYEFAHEKGITTMPTINDANMNGKLTRIAMAKMLSYYAINVLGQKPDETRINKFNDITEKLDAQYDSGVTLAYQLGIMGINMPNNNFRPNDEVTRAEFATALSRMLYSTPDGKPYYATHLEKLKAAGILTNDDPKMKELRGYVMIMLMRSAK